MTPDDTLIRQAYIDEELSVDQVIAFESTLNARNKAEVEAERHFENTVGQHLREATVPCPDELWERLQRQVHNAAPAADPPHLEHHAPLRRFAGWGLAAAAALALVLIAAFALHPPPATAPTPYEVAFTSDLETFAADAVIPGDYQKVHSALTANGFYVNLADPTHHNSHHDVQLLGMRVIDEPTGKTAQLYFSCCNEPVAVFIQPLARRHCLERLPVEQLDGQAWHVGVNQIDKYRVVAVGPHDPQGVLGLFS